MAEYHKRCVDHVCSPDPPIIKAESVFFNRYVKAKEKNEIVSDYRTKIDQSGDEA